jgi:hypothetical protein
VRLYGREHPFGFHRSLFVDMTANGPGYALGMEPAGCRAPTEENTRFPAAKARDNVQCVWVKIPVRANLTELLDLALLGARVLTLTAEIRDLQLRFSALEGRFAAMESRFSAMEIRLGAIERRLGVQEERMSAMLAVIVRIAERLDRTTEPSSG